jgi:hypothetical protein
LNIYQIRAAKINARMTNNTCSGHVLTNSSLLAAVISIFLSISSLSMFFHHKLSLLIESFIISSQEFIPDISSQEFIPDISSQEFIPDISSQEFIPDISSQEFIPDISSQEFIPDIPGIPLAILSFSISAISSLANFSFSNSKSISLEADSRSICSSSILNLLKSSEINFIAQSNQEVIVDQSLPVIEKIITS